VRRAGAGAGGRGRGRRPTRQAHLRCRAHWLVTSGSMPDCSTTALRRAQLLARGRRDGELLQAQAPMRADLIVARHPL
jgi:hypothetical protein